MATALAERLVLIPRWPSGLPPDVKRLLFVRHAEGWHNKHYRERPEFMSEALGETEEYWDARLTPDGITQSEKLQTEVRPRWAELVVVSPLTRAIQTASIAWPNTTKWDRPPFVATSLARERISTHQCDRRRSRATLAAEFPHVDFSEVADGEDEMWESKEHFPSELNSTAATERAAELLHWLWRRPESQIAIVSHWVFMKHLFKIFPHHADLNADFDNAEMRMATLWLRAPTVPTGGKEEL